MMTDKTKINRKFLGTIRVLLTLCVGMLLLQSAFSQEQALGGKAKGKVRKSEEATPHRIVIAPVTISIPDESALINVLRSFSTPPDPLSIVFEDGRVMFVRGIGWQTAPASGTAKTPPKGYQVVQLWRGPGPAHVSRELVLCGLLCGD
jgi:hypothetical protein